jgi:hypothetical protein
MTKQDMNSILMKLSNMFNLIEESEFISNNDSYKVTRTFIDIIEKENIKKPIAKLTLLKKVDNER